MRVQQTTKSPVHTHRAKEISKVLKEFTGGGLSGLPLFKMESEDKVTYGQGRLK